MKTRPNPILRGPRLSRGDEVHVTRSLITRTEFLIGLFAVVLSVVLLLIYVIWQPNPIESYYVTNFSYSKCYLHKTNDYRYIGLESGDKIYRIDFHLWQDTYSAEYVVNELSKHYQAKIWLTSKDDIYIQGIATPPLIIDPSVGAAWDKTNRQAILWLSGGFFILGILLLALKVILRPAPNNSVNRRANNAAFIRKT